MHFLKSIKRTFTSTSRLLERKRFILTESPKPRTVHPTHPAHPTTNDEIRDILGLDQTIDKEGREILEQFYKQEPVKELSRFNRRVFEKETMPKVTPWMTTAAQSGMHFLVCVIVDAKVEAVTEDVVQDELSPLETTAANINTLVAEDKHTEAIQYLSTTNSESLHPQLFGIIARSLSTRGQSTRAIQILEEMMATHKFLPDDATYNTLIQDLCKTFDYSKASSLLNHMHSHNLTATSATYEHIIDACAADSSSDAVQSLIESFQARHILLTTPMINTLILSLSTAHDYQSAIQVFRSLKSTYSLEPNEITLETILNTFITCNKVNDSVLVLDQLLEMDSVLVSDYAFKVFEICVKGRKYQSAVKILSEMRKKDALSESVSKLLLKHAEEWENALKHLLTVNESSQAALANKYDFDSLQPAHPTSPQDQESTKSLALYLYKQLLSYKIKLSSATITLLIRVYHKNNDLVSAVRCWSIHHAQNPVPHPQILDALLHAIRDLGQEKTTLSVLSLRLNEAWPLTPKITQHLLVLMSRYGLVKELVGVVMDMEKEKGEKIGFRVEDYATCLSTMKSFGRTDAVDGFVLFCEECVPGVVEEYEERIEKIRLRGNSI